ncbi:hypothetical protein CkaCkLH20_08470 [Colletotrichum karsti]|uniref:Secreted protein n=1 Tax=Colletotrichum karsti TaxID=1095194 RepID=A0A9P6I085_9PEZI|nr:uncharacterized protein CkaCkLH20_08470 [Colletotrichum karsti]KAF9874098.1 hypothetical protein CkaCkLH20_08470 [Colletotrichum karsti]
MRFSAANLALAAIAALSTTALASPAGLDARQAANDDAPKPAADYCCCDSRTNSYNCKVPAAEGGAPDPFCTKQLCPHDVETQKQCCCCWPNDEPWTVKCKAVPKDEACACPAIYCPFTWGEQYLPGYPWTSPA